MKIGELAGRSGTQVATIRFYESKGLLHPPARSVGNYRLYTPDHAERLLFIRHCRTLDMSLEEIRSLLHFKDSPTEPCGKVSALLEAHVVHVADRIQELQALQRQLRRLRTRCRSAQDSAHCGILNELSDPTQEPVPTNSVHDRRVRVVSAKRGT
jgi:Cd(II)/Pb(II)-responsive transcriptional regulator